ncbi:MAG: glycosyltransferase family 2 protein [Solirubrobacteraceae bacterium]
MPTPIAVLYAAAEVGYLLCLLVVLWFYTRRVDLVDIDAAVRSCNELPCPDIIVLYPVLDELESTMRTAMLGFQRAEYPRGTRRVIAIPNADDHSTIESLRRIADDHEFLEVLPVPPTDDPRWQPVWTAWEKNPKAYWWHVGKRHHARDLPPKKTRQLTYAFYTLAAAHPDALLSYIDADSVVPPDYFLTAAGGMQHYDVIQNTNVAGNALDTWATSMFAMDHMSWDGSLYQHMTAGGRHPFYVLGKGLFFRISDLVEVGGFHPWLTIEDPEIGMRLWTNGRRLGVVRSPLIEEVPNTFGHGVTQRKRWVAGFFQSLGAPLTLMGMRWRQRLRARLNFVPCLSLLICPIGLTVGVWALVAAVATGHRVVSLPLEVLSLVTIAMMLVVVGISQRAAYRQTGLFLLHRRERIRMMLRINPVFVFVFWLWWAIPLAIGFTMFVRDTGLRWERTRKVDANHDLVRDEIPIITEAMGAPSGDQVDVGPAAAQVVGVHGQPSDDR